MTRWMVRGVAGALLVALTWPGALDAGTPGVEVTLFRFRPGTLEVSTGSAVTWVNRDDIGHTVTSGAPETPAGGFDVALDGQAGTATVRFTEPGVYPYFCRRHPAMRGEVRVQ
jgi:plastocyanin